ncbi:hypothetical protein Tco_0908867 [Tanacetum coccineum]|uniref:Uncharacterized protein n=1 Tax=Tanacetum coccineum TaxID=301880 RepID=A0ABQ5CR49_9ASTR
MFMAYKQPQPQNCSTPPPPKQQTLPLHSTSTRFIMIPFFHKSFWSELEQHIANLAEENQALEIRLDKQGNRIHKLESVDVSKMIREQTVEFIDSQEIDRKINESVKEVVISSVNHAMRDPLRARFKDLPTVSIHHDECEDFDDDKAQEETKKKGKQDSLKPPPGLPPSPPPPPLPPSGASGASGLKGHSICHQAPPLQPYALVENSLLAQTGDMATFMDWYCKQQGISEITPKDLEGPAFEIVKVFHHDVIHLQFQMEECHKLLTDQVDDAILRYNVNKPLLLGGEPGPVTIQSDFFFNRDLEYLRYGRKCLISSGLQRNASMTLQLCMVSLIGGFKDNDSTLDPVYSHLKGDSRPCCRLHMAYLKCLRIEVYFNVRVQYMKNNRSVLVNSSRSLGNTYYRRQKILTTAVNLMVPENLVIQDTARRLLAGD